MSKGKAASYSAGVKAYRQTYWEPDYRLRDTDLLACFKITPQPGVEREEAAAAASSGSTPSCGVMRNSASTSVSLGR